MDDYDANRWTCMHKKNLELIMTELKWKMYKAQNIYNSKISKNF